MQSVGSLVLPALRHLKTLNTSDIKCPAVYLPVYKDYSKMDYKLKSYASCMTCYRLNCF